MIEMTSGVKLRHGNDGQEPGSVLAVTIFIKYYDVVYASWETTHII